MTKENIDTIRNLFDSRNIANALERFHIYIHAVIAEFVFSNDDSSRLSDYHDAWLSSRAEAYKKYLNSVPAESEAVLVELCKYVRDSDGVDFISSVSAGLFAGDVSSVFSYLGSTKLNRRAFIYNLIKIYGLCRYRADLYGSSYPSFPSRLPKDEILKLIETHFDYWGLAETYKLLLGFREKIQEMWLLMFGAPFVPEKVSSMGIAGIMKDLSDLGLSHDVALELFYICKTAHSFDLKKIDEPFSYFRKILQVRVDEGLQVEADDFGGEIASPGAAFYLKEDMFNKILAKWKAIDTVDFVRSTYFAAYSKNLCAENSLAMPYYLKFCNQPNGIIVFDANPDFILSVSELGFGAKSGVLFAQSSRRLAMLYKQRFPNLDFAFFQSDGGNNVCLIQIDIEEQYAGKELRFISQPVSKIYGMAIMFARRESESLLSTVADILADKIDMNDGVVHLFCPNTLLDTKGRSIRTALAKKYDFNWIQILPAAASSAWLKKNTIVCLTRKKEGYSEDVCLIHTDMYDNPMSDELRLICQDPWPVRMPQSEFANSQSTVNRLWEQFRPKPEKDSVRKTREWKFSAEISLWYSWSNKRGRVQYYGVPTEKQQAANPLRRGERLTPPYVYSTKSIEDAEERFAEIIWSDKFKPIIVEDIKRAYKYRPMTLQTFWYCHEDELKEKTGYSVEAAERIFESQPIAGLLSDGEYSLEVFQDLVEDLTDDYSKKNSIRIWRTLNAIISLANQSGRFLPNVIGDYVRSMVEKDRGYQQVRKNLAKRSYELEEELRMLDLLQMNLPYNGAFVGAAISFYCGIVNRQICALTWGDYKKLFGDEVGQLWITKELTNKGEIKTLGLDDKNMLRRVPVVRQLVKILDKRFEFVKMNWKAEDSSKLETEVMVLPIVSQADLKSRYSPADIKLAKDQMEAAADIEPMEVSISKIGAKVTDLNEYSGDRFRSNFLYRALQTSNMSRGEANYIYGISLPTTFAKHYCDYTNDFAQLMMCRKLERWTSLHQEKKCEVGVIENRISATGRQIRIDKRVFHRSTVELRLTVQGEKRLDECRDLLVTINDDRGVNLTIRKSGGRHEQ